MNIHEELKNLIVEHSQASTEMFWNKIYDMFRFLSDIGDLNGNKNNAITEYLKNVNKEEPNYFQDITVQDNDIDLVLKRYMFEAAMLRIVIEFDIDPLENVSAESKIEIIKAIENCFDKIFNYQGSPNAFLYIKTENKGVHIYADRVKNRIFDAKLSLT